MNQIGIFGAGAKRLQMTCAIEMTTQSLPACGASHDHWGIAWSGGKDSSAMLTLVMWLVDPPACPVLKL
jgi:DNA sulfur modification protein DndC